MTKSVGVLNSKGSSLLALTEGLESLIDTQTVVSGLVPGAVTPEVTPAQIASYSLALIREVGELADELGWKPWKEQPERDLERIADEMADVLAFVGLLLIYVEHAGVSPTDLAQAYRSKSMRNIARFFGKEDGYKDFGSEHGITLEWLKANLIQF